jgi:ABC-2 type transport system ATP-binding protein
LHLAPVRVGKSLRITSGDGNDVMTMWAPIASRLGDSAESISIGRASLEDVFVAKTGKSFN